MNLDINVDLVRKLIANQFPQWAGLAVTPIFPGGWDNRTFRLGDALVVRLPSSRDYAAQITREQRWVPQLAPHLPVQIPELRGAGRPDAGFPFHWSVLRWLQGESAATARIADLRIFANDLALSLLALQRIDATGGPPAGAHNFHRGGALAEYDDQIRQALDVLGGGIDRTAAKRLWGEALATRWHHPPVWVHGDIAPGNLLVQDGRLAAVIDFGALAVGDPACDLAIAWTLLDNESRRQFQSAFKFDADVWLRARAWVLWKALIVAAGLTQTNAPEYAAPLEVVDRVLRGNSL